MVMGRMWPCPRLMWLNWDNAGSRFGRSVLVARLHTLDIVACSGRVTAVVGSEPATLETGEAELDRMMDDDASAKRYLKDRWERQTRE